MPRIDGLDGLRILSALGVLVYHVLGEFVGGNPSAGVILPPVAFVFFLISGYVIFRPFAVADLTGRPLPALRPYYTSRLLRVMPLWLLVVGVHLVVFGTDPLRGTADWVLTLTLLQVVDPEIRYAIIGPAWALSTEWVFYLLAPLWARGVVLLRRSTARRTDPARWQLSSLLPVAAFCVVVPAARPFLATVFGVALAIVHVEHTRSGRFGSLVPVLRSTDLGALITAVGWFLLLVYPYRQGLSVQWASNDPLLLLLWMTVATAWFCPVVFGSSRGPITSRLAHPLMVRLATLTFGLYLWHDLFIRIVARELGTDTHLLGAMYLVSIGSVLAAVITFVGLEEPLIRVRHRWGNSRTPLLSSIRRLRPASPPDRTERPIDGVRLVAAIALLGHLVVSRTASAPGIRRAGDLLGVTAIALLLVLAGFSEYRPFVAARARGASVGRPIRHLLHRLGLLLPLYWCGLILVLLRAGGEDLDGWTDWFQIVTLSPSPDPQVLLRSGLGPAVWALSALVLFALYLPVHVRLTGWASTRVTSRPAELLPVAALLVLTTTQALAGSRYAVVLPCLPLGMALAVLDVERRSDERLRRTLRRIGSSADALFALGLLVLVADWALATEPSRVDAPGSALVPHAPAAIAAAVLTSIAVVLGSPRSAPNRFLRTSPVRAWSLATYGILVFSGPIVHALAVRVDLPATALFGATLVAVTVAGVAARRLVTDPIGSATLGLLPPSLTRIER